MDQGCKISQFGLFSHFNDMSCFSHRFLSGSHSCVAFLQSFLQRVHKVVVLFTNEYTFTPLLFIATIRGKTPKGVMGAEAPPNDEKLVICHAIFLAAGMFIRQISVLGTQMFFS